MNKKTIFNSIIVISAGILLSGAISYAKTATTPPGGFPANNPEQPVNIGPQNPLTPYQTKAGSLMIGPLVVNGKTLFTGTPGHVEILGITSPPVDEFTRLNNNLGDKNFLASLIDSLDTKKAIAGTCSYNASTDSCEYCSLGTVPDYNFIPPTCTSLPPPPATAPQIYLEALTNYNQGTSVTIPQYDWAEIDWAVSGSGTVTCTASAAPSTPDWNTSTTYTAQGLYGYVPLSMSATSVTRTYTMSCSNTAGSASKSVTVTVLIPPTNTSNLYVSGKVCLGTGVGPGTCNPNPVAAPIVGTVESLEVNGNIKIDYLQFGAPKKVCADTAGKLVICI